MARQTRGHGLAWGKWTAQVLMIAAGWGPAGTSIASQVVAKSDGVKVFATADKNSAVVQELKKDESIAAQERKGMYWQVTLDGAQTGFVSVMAVKHEPAKEGGGLSSALREAVQRERSGEDSSNMRSRSAVMGVRGLDESSETAFAGNVKPNLRMVYTMESYFVQKESVAEIGRKVEAEIEKRLNQKKR